MKSSRAHRWYGGESLESRRLLATDVFHDPSEWIRYDICGQAYAVDPVPTDLVVEGETDPDRDFAGGGVVAAADTTNTIPLLHSFPEASQKIYLDFDGQVVSNTNWNDNNQGRPIEARPFDTDGDPTSWSNGELFVIERIWARVSEDYAPFQLDVTTEEPPLKDFTAGNQAIRVIISTDTDERTGNRWFTGAGGVAYIGSWNWRSDTPVWVFTNNIGTGEKNVAEAAAHESGHAFGLGHDGTQSGTSYFAGHGSGRVGWAPIMGVGYGRDLTQWSRGEYTDANNLQNDLSVIASSNNDVLFRRDDHSSTQSRATELVPDDTGSIQGLGVISRSTDVDLFTFSVKQGEVTIEVSPAERGPNLDIEATLIDAAGNELQVVNPERALDARITATLEAGSYYLKIDGVGYADPATDGYSDYGSLGQYSISIAQTPVEAPIAQIVARHLFYDNSKFDQFILGPSEADSNAIAVDKTPLLPGQTASWSNYSNYVAGINGIMVDIQGGADHSLLDLADFRFRIGNSNDVGQWQEGPRPSQFRLLSGKGLGGSDRIVMTWDEGIFDVWLQVTLIAGRDTGLPADDIFYFGNARGDTGDSSENSIVDMADFEAIRQNSRDFLHRADISDRYDLNRDSFVDATDLVWVRDHPSDSATALLLLALPPDRLEEA